jgi:pilus assembly protein CpaB
MNRGIQARGGHAVPRHRKLIRRHRRGLSALATALAVACFGLAMRPSAPEMTSLVVFARDLPSGHRLEPEDLRLVAVPADLQPASGLTDANDATDHVLAAPALAGEAVAPIRLTSSLGWTAPRGTSAVPIRFADAASARLLSAGMSITIHATDASPLDADLASIQTVARARIITTGAEVLSVSPTPNSEEGGELNTDNAPLVILALRPDEAAAVIGAEASSRITFSLEGVP